MVVLWFREEDLPHDDPFFFRQDKRGHTEPQGASSARPLRVVENDLLDRESRSKGPPARRTKPVDDVAHLSEADVPMQPRKR